MSIMIYCVIQADNDKFINLGWLERTVYLTTLSPLIFKINTWVMNAWIYSEFFVMLLNKRKRAVHDFIAGTVMVKAKYLEHIKAAMSETELPTGEALNKTDIIDDVI